MPEVAAQPPALSVTQADIHGAFRTLCGRDILPAELDRYSKLCETYKWNHYSLLMHLMCHAEAQGRLEFPEIVKSGVMTAAPLHNGMTIFGPISDLFVTHAIKRKGQWEPHEEKVMRQLVKPGMQALDLGANIGYFTAVLSEVVGADGKVWAVEAAPRLCECLKKSSEFNHWKNVEILNVAASNNERELLMGYNFVNFGGSTVYELPPGHALDTLWQAKVTARRLDDVLPAQEKIDFIKMDIEGHEGHALTGMKKIFERGRPRMLFEYTPAALNQGPLPARQMFEWMEALGYKFETVKKLCRIDGDLAEYVKEKGLHTAGILQATQQGGYEQWNLVCVAQ